MHSSIFSGGEIIANYTNSEPQLNRIRSFYEEHKFGNILACGFKTKLRDVADKSEFKKLLIGLEARIIYLDRKNVIKTVVSKFNAARLNEAKGVWNITAKDDRIAKLPIDVKEFNKWLTGTLNYKRELEQFVSGLNNPVLNIYYEDIILKESVVFNHIFDFLGVEHEYIKGKFIKYTNDDLKESVLNFNELKKHYHGTDYENMFDEVLIKNI